MYEPIGGDEVFLREKTCPEKWFSKTNYTCYSCSNFFCSKGECYMSKCTRGDAPQYSLFSICLLPFSFLLDTICLPCSFISNVCCD